MQRVAWGGDILLGHHLEEILPCQVMLPFLCIIPQSSCKNAAIISPLISNLYELDLYLLIILLLSEWQTPIKILCAAKDLKNDTWQSTLLEGRDTASFTHTYTVAV